MIRHSRRMRVPQEKKSASTDPSRRKSRNLSNQPRPMVSLPVTGLTRRSFSLGPLPLLSLSRSRRRGWRSRRLHPEPEIARKAAGAVQVGEDDRFGELPLAVGASRERGRDRVRQRDDGRAATALVAERGRKSLGRVTVCSGRRRRTGRCRVGSGRRDGREGCGRRRGRVQDRRNRKRR